MIPATFAYSRPKSLDEALGLLAQHAGSAKVLAGGQSILPLLKLRVASVERLVDIGRLSELRGVRSIDGGISIGALTTYRELIELPAAMAYTLIAESVPDIGDIQVRNRGTVGGALAHADPASDLPAVMLALDATLVVRSSRGERTVKVEDWFQGAFTSALEPDEILTEVRLPGASSAMGSAYRTISQPASGYSIVGAAVVIGHAHGILGSSSIDHVRVAVTGVGEIAYRATAVEAALIGTDCNPGAIAAAAAHATDGQTVNSDIHADREYRTAVAAVITRRALEAARARVA